MLTATVARGFRHLVAHSLLKAPREWSPKKEMLRREEAVRRGGPVDAMELCSVHRWVGTYGLGLHLGVRGSCRRLPCQV